jgi:hypothetical protein
MTVYSQVVVIQPTLKAAASRVPLFGVLGGEFVAFRAERGHRFSGFSANQTPPLLVARIRWVSYKGMTMRLTMPGVNAALPTPTVAAWSPDRVRVVVWVTLRARLDYLTGPGDIHRVGNRFQVRWIAT